MASEEEEEEGGGGVEGGAPAWMATYADLATLLLTFFVLLLSFASMDVQEFRVALGSVRDAMGVQFEHPGNVSALATSVIELSKTESTDQLTIMEIKLLSEIEKAISDSKLRNKIEAEVSELGVTIRVRDQLLFKSGEAVLADPESEVMDLIAKLTKDVKMPLWIEGHTDDRPIRSRLYQSNWELSAGRATAAMRYLVDKHGVNPARIRVGGYAHYKPLASNDTVEGRNINRRVEFLFMNGGDTKSLGIKTEDIEEVRSGLGVFTPDTPTDSKRPIFQP